MRLYNDYFEKPYSIGCRFGCNYHAKGHTEMEVNEEWQKLTEVKLSLFARIVKWFKRA